MDQKAKLLESVSAALESGLITRDDIKKVLETHSTKTTNYTLKKSMHSNLSAVDLMFYIAGIVLYAAIAALVSQIWDSGPMIRVLLSAGTGTVFWAIALYLTTRRSSDDIRRGITNSLLLTGSLALITGGFIITNEFISLEGRPEFYAASITLALLGTLHLVFGWQIRRDLLLLIGILLTVASFPTLMFGILRDNDTPMFVYCLAIAASGALLAYITRVVAKIGASNNVSIGKVFDPLSVFSILMSLYVASYDDTTGPLWLLVLIFGIIGLFYLSIITQDKLLLGSGSFFLVLSIITISFRYFSDSPAISLLVSAAGLLGTAIMAAHINRRYLN